MKMYVVLVTIIVGGIVSLLFMTGSDTAPNEVEIASTETENADSAELDNNLTLATADPVAIVNGEEISNADFTAQQSQILATQGIDQTTLDQETLLAVQNQVLDSLISQTLLQQAAKDSGIGVSEAEIDMELDVVKSQFEDEILYEQALASEGLTEAELRTQLATDLSVEPYLEQTLNLSSITVTEEEVAQAYEELSTQQELPALEQVQTEIEQLVIQQKQQPLIAQHIAQLREEANIEVLI